LLGSARAWQGKNPQRALTLATQAAALMAPARAGDDNAARRWLQAQALGEQAVAQAALGRAEAARATARQALATWGEHPPALAAWVARDRQLAGAP
jgi:hypothetical protein